MSASDDRRTVLTANQLISLSLTRARRDKGWTQTEASERLAPYLGARWSKATYSAAERSVERPDRIRQFTADHLLAFAAAFDMPIQMLFLPPRPDRGETELLITAGGPASTHAFSLSEYLRCTLGSPEAITRHHGRLVDVMAAAARNIPGFDMAGLNDSVRATIAARLRAHRELLDAWEDALTGLRDLLREAARDPDPETPAQ